MAKLKRLATKDDVIVDVCTPISDTEIEERHKDYEQLEPRKFAFRYNPMLYLPTTFTLNGETHSIQYNYCINPFCHNFGKEQKKFESVKGKPSRYKIGGSSNYNKEVICNDNSLVEGITLNCSVNPFSNWSIAEEIKRLVQVGSVLDIEPDYQFHKDGCADSSTTPFKDTKNFYSRGETKAKSHKYQCKTCKKYTNVLPNRERSTTYHQKKNEILPTFARLLVGKGSVKRACEILQIGNGTYYHKLKWLYRRCLEFLERYETKPLKMMEFNEVWLNTDKMNYYLNNVINKGQKAKKYPGLEERQLQTYLVVTADASSRYVFRSDIAYDSNITLDDLERDTILYKEDHLNTFCRKNDRLEWSYYPQEPTDNDTEDVGGYKYELNKIKKRSQYVDGLHVNVGYTNTAHFWLIKNLVNAKEWRLITDDDKSIRNAFYRVFTNEIRLSDAHHFIAQSDKTKGREQCEMEFEDAKNHLHEWGDAKGYKTRNLRTLASHYLEEVLHKHEFSEVKVKDGLRYIVHKDNPLEHPLASKDRGFHTVDCMTDLSSYEPGDIAKMIMNVNDHSVNSFIQLVRRRISSLERPLTTARGDKKSYIYANLNPVYAQYMVTILRTYYNFCKPMKMGNKKLTPAQRIGITDKQFKLEDIIYFK
ncbi:insertion element protein [Salirhabdus salicampi]|uniref:insertion element protein n=1 Tax=Salirhabdus salicampi TaxID=476102 RepID=UPI0020C32ADC|nr:insertion element protein [Salirhabdus salicampi]MCP8615460.1 insertion element protein [Salirhabdus salicampi]